MSMFAGLLSVTRSSIEAMPYEDQEWFWEVPARVISVVDGASFVADLDLGWGIHYLQKIICEGITVEAIETMEGMEARKEAQRLLTDALVILRCREVRTVGSLCEVVYSPWFTPRSEQGSFAAAMLASGFARKME